MNSDTGKSDVEDIDGFEIESQKINWNIFESWTIELMITEL